MLFQLSKIMINGKTLAESNFASLLLNNQPLEFVNEYKYLGVELCAGKALTFSPLSMIWSFHRAANAILYSRVKPSATVLMKLLYTNCVPIITYASAVRDFSSADMYRCHVAINNAIRKIFSFSVWQSIRHLRISHGYKSIYEIFSSAKAKFLANASTSSNSIVCHLFSMHWFSLVYLKCCCKHYHLSVDEIKNNYIQFFVINCLDVYHSV